MKDSELEKRLATLEAKVKLLEDREKILTLMATYGPAMDTCTENVITAMWTEEGVYDTDGHRFVGNRDVGSLTRVPEHRAVVAGGAAHVIGMPCLRIEGDSAEATGYSVVYLNKGDHHEVMRASANHWQFTRTARGWRVVNRINRRLNGSEESLAVLKTALGNFAEA